MFEHLLVLSLLGVINVSNVSVFVVPYLLFSMLAAKFKNTDIYILSVLAIMVVTFTIIAMGRDFDGSIALKSNLTTLLIFIFVGFSDLFKVKELIKVIECYIFLLVIYVLAYLYSVDYNLWKLRHAKDFLLIGWPTNAPLVFLVFYFLVDQYKEYVRHVIISKIACVSIIFVSLNRVSIFFCLMLVLVDFLKVGNRTASKALLTSVVIILALYYWEWIIDFVSIYLRFDDMLSSLNPESSIGTRIHTTWAKAGEAIQSFPMFGTGGVGLGHLDRTQSNLTTESVYVDSIMRYGLLAGTILIMVYITLLVGIWKSFHANLLIYPISGAFLTAFALSDVMRYPHVLLLIATFYGVAKRNDNVFLRP